MWHSVRNCWIATDQFYYTWSGWHKVIIAIHRLASHWATVYKVPIFSIRMSIGPNTTSKLDDAVRDRNCPKMC